MRSTAEQVILVTGATDGLGQAVAGELATRGATVLLHGRDDGRLADTIEEIHAGTQSEELRAYRADFHPLHEVRDLADTLVRGEERLDVLVNNAGIGSTLPGDGQRLESQDGHELRFAVNYLAPSAHRRLLPLLERSAPARIVNVSSLGQAPIDFDDVMLERALRRHARLRPEQARPDHAAFDLAERLAPRGSPSTPAPGDLHADEDRHRTPRGDSIEHARGGRRGDRAAGRRRRRSRASPAASSTAQQRGARPRQAYDPEARRRLWELSEALVGLGP